MLEPIGYAFGSIQMPESGMHWIYYQCRPFVSATWIVSDIRLIFINMADDIKLPIIYLSTEITRNYLWNNLSIKKKLTVLNVTVHLKKTLLKMITVQNTLEEISSAKFVSMKIVR